MANSTITVEGWDGNPFTQDSIEGLAGRFLTTTYKLKFGAGNYATGGLTLDFTNGGSNTAVPAAQNGGLVSVVISAKGVGTCVVGKGGNYVFIAGTTLANGLLKIFVTAGTEYSAGALGTDVTNDLVYLTCKWKR